MSVLRASILFSILFAICACAGGFGQSSAQILKKDDFTFRKRAYADKTGNKMPYRIFVPANYDPRQKYPLIFWIHGAAGRGSDNLKQISGGNENGTHVWTTRANQTQLPPLSSHRNARRIVTGRSR